MADVRDNISVKSFRATPYEESSWQVIGEIVEHAHLFSESKFEFVDAHVAGPDPMFEDFGGSVALKRYVRGESGLPQVSKIQTEEIIKLEQEVERLQAQVRESYDEGKVAGREEKERESQLATTNREAALKEILQDMQSQMNEQMVHLEKQAIQLSVSLVEKILGHVVEAQPEYIGIVVKEALRYVGSSKVRKVRVSPQDMEFIEVVGIKESLAQFDFSVSFEADPSIRSGCVVETSDGEIDSRLSEAFDAVKDKILKSVG